MPRIRYRGDGIPAQEREARPAPYPGLRPPLRCPLPQLVSPRQPTLLLGAQLRSGSRWLQVQAPHHLDPQIDRPAPPSHPTTHFRPPRQSHFLPELKTFSSFRSATGLGDRDEQRGASSPGHRALGAVRRLVPPRMRGLGEGRQARGPQSPRLGVRGAVVLITRARARGCPSVHHPCFQRRCRRPAN